MTSVVDYSNKGYYYSDDGGSDNCDPFISSTFLVAACNKFLSLVFVVADEPDEKNEKNLEINPHFFFSELMTTYLNRV